MLDKTWRYREALLSYEQALQRDPGCLEALYGKGEMLKLDPTAARAWAEKGYILITSLHRGSSCF